MPFNNRLAKILFEILPSPFGRGVGGESDSGWSVSDGFFDTPPPDTFDDGGSYDDWTYVDIDTFEATF
jgi:hypothetical protein